MRQYDIVIPSTQGLHQTEEYFLVTLDGEQVKIALHDYPTIYQYPWLYETVVYQRLGCNSPKGICDILQKVFTEHHIDPTFIHMLEIGAGSGIFAEHLKTTLNIGKIYGLDIHQEAKIAAYRERNNVYSGYYIADLTNLSAETVAEFSQQKFNCVGFASAVGMNHIPVEGIEQALQLLEPNGWFIFHAKPNDPDDGCIHINHWIHRKIENTQITLVHRESCFHRYSTNGEKIYYDVIVAVKNVG